MEKLEIIYSVEGGKTTKLIVSEPKENLTKAQVKEAADKIAKILTNAKKMPVKAFEKAQKVTREVEELE